MSPLTIGFQGAAKTYSFTGGIRYDASCAVAVEQAVIAAPHDAHRSPSHVPRSGQTAQARPYFFIFR